MYAGILYFWQRFLSQNMWFQDYIFFWVTNSMDTHFWISVKPWCYAKKWAWLKFWLLSWDYSTNIIIHQTHRNRSQSWGVIILTSVAPLIKRQWDCHSVWNSLETQNTTDLGCWRDHAVAMRSKQKGFLFNPFQPESWTQNETGYVNVHAWIKHQYDVDWWRQRTPFWLCSSI